MIAASLAACSGSGSGPAPAQSASLKWENCTQAKYPTMNQTVVDYFGARLQCSMMTVPIDYRHPSHGHLEIALSKVSAGNPRAKIGSLFMNPGGPGGSGLSLAPDEAMFFDQADSSTAPGAQLHQLSERYDFIGFDPRGVPSSSPLTCELNQFYQPEFVATQDQSADNFNNIYSNQQLDAQACRSSALTPFVNSDATARDLDRARQLMGLRKLDYYGYSYGTWLGVWYASVFPTHVNHIVLDSTVDFTQPLVSLDQTVPMQFVLDDIIIPYAALHPELFNLGTSPAAIRNIYFTLSLQLQTALSNELYGFLFNQRSANTVVEYLSAANVISQVVEDDPTITDQQLRNLLSTYGFSNDPTINAQTQQIALTLEAAYIKLVNGTPIPVVLENADGINEAVNKAVSCNDANAPTDQSYWDQLVASIAADAPAFFHDRYELNCTAEWKGATVTRPDPARARKIGNIMMVQDQYDAATPLDGALATYDALGNASLVYNSNSYTHGVFPGAGGCVDSAVVDYLLNPVSNTHTKVSCEGTGLIPVIPAPMTKPQLYQANRALGAVLANVQAQPNPDYLNQVFRDPVEARSLIENIRAQIGPH